MAKGSFVPEKSAVNTEKLADFNAAVNALRVDTLDDSSNDDSWAKKVNQISWEQETYKSDDPNATE